MVVPAVPMAVGTHLEVVMTLPRAITRPKEIHVPTSTEVVRTQEIPSTAPAAMASAVAGRKRKTLILNARRLDKQRTLARTVTKRVPALLRLEVTLDVLIKVHSRFTPKEKLDAPCLMPPTFTAQWKRDSPKSNREHFAWRLGTAFLTLNFQEASTRIWQKPSCTRHAKIEEASFHKLCWITAEVMRTPFITTSA